MAEGRARRQWDHTASINYYQANAFSSKRIPLEKFNPYAKRRRVTNGVPWNASNNSNMITLFCGKN